LLNKTSKPLLTFANLNSKNHFLLPIVYRHKHMNIKQLSAFFCLIFVCFFNKNTASAQCPTLSQNSMLDPCNGQVPCNLCPGDVVTLTTSGTNLQPGRCVNWYMSTTPNFNPYAGQGNLLECSQIALAPPSDCDACPEIVGLFIDACGVEQANEFFGMTSGSGFYVNDLIVDFDDANNISLPQDGDINDGGCPWGTPSGATVAAIQAACPGVSVVGVGSGDIVPPGVLVIVLTSAGFSNPYGWGGLCPLINSIYVMQNSCTRINQAFSNTGGSQTTSINLACGCSDAATFNSGSLSGGNGAFFTDFLFPFYGNAGCGFPNFMIALPPAPPPVLQVPPLDTTLWAGLCNGGPYYVVGAYQPLPPGCPPALTNYMQFNVVCPTPMLQMGQVCNSINNYNLDDLVDPAIPNGTWTGANVSGSTFNALNLSPGNYTVTFDPDGDCALVKSTIITVFQAPKATLVAGTMNVCAGTTVNLTINFTGTPPFQLDYSANGMVQPTVFANATPYILMVTPNVNTNYSLVEMSDANCLGTVTGVYNITTLPSPSATISGNTTICAGQTTNLIIDFSGNAPWTYSFSANGVIIDTLITSKDPDTLVVFPLDTTVYKIVKIQNASCTGAIFGMATVNVPASSSAILSGSTAICGSGQAVDLTVNFTGGGPWTFIHTRNNVAQPPITTNINPYILTVTPTLSTTYIITSVMSANCAGQVSGVAIVTVATAPSAVLSGNATICSGSSTPISVNFTNGAAPWTFVYSINNVAQPAVTTAIDPFVISVNPTMTAIYNLVSVASGTCTGTVSFAPIQITVAPPFNSAIAGTATINLGQSTNLILSVLNAPVGATITYNLTANGTAIPPIVTTQNPFNLPVNPAVSTVYEIISCTVFNCPATSGSTATVTVQNNFGATISTDTTICAGGQANILIDFTGGGSGPFTFIYAINGIAQPAVTTISDPYFLNISPTNNANLALVSVTAGNGTSGAVSGTATVTVNSPSLAISPVLLPLCAGTSGNFTVILSNGTPPFTFQYEINGTVQPTVVSPTASFQLPVTASQSTSYGLISGQNGTCSTLFSNGSASVQIVAPPQPNNVQISCNLVGGNYTVSFDVANQPNPAGATLVNGTPVSGGIFTSAPILLANNYAFNLTNGCGQTQVAGQNTCLCVTDAGTMTFLDTLEVCVGGQIVAAHDNDQILEPNDIFEYILYTPGIPVGNILATNATSPTFSFLPATMATGFVYYISAIAGNDNGASHVDLNDPCLSVAAGTPIVFFDPPTMTIEVTDTSICAGDTVKLLIKLAGNGPFKFTYTKDGQLLPPVTTTKNVANDTYTISAILQQSTIFQITSFSDATCAGVLPPPVSISVNQIPTLLTQPLATCNLINFTYTVGCTLQGGTNPYLFTGGLGSFTGAYFESGPIPIGSPFNYFLGDIASQECGFVEIQGNPNCACATNAGDFGIAQTLVFCAGSPAILPPIFGSNLEPDDTLIYILHTTAGSNPLAWTILGTNNVPQFNFIAGLLSPDSTYYISAIAGNHNATGLDLTDPCISISTGVAIKWRPPVSAFLTGNIEICQGDTANLDIIFSGNDAPYSFVLLINGVAQSPQISQTDTFNLDVNPSLSANYSLQSVNGATCPGSFNGGGGAAVSVKFPPFLVEYAQTCDFINSTYSITFKITNGVDPANTYLLNGTAGTLTSDTIFTSNPIPFGTPYDITISTPIGCEASISGLGQCACTTNAGTMNLNKIDGCIGSAIFPIHNGDQSLDADDTEIYFILFENALDPLASILETTKVPASFNFDAATMSVGTTYFISAIAGNNDGTGNIDQNDPCFSISPPVELVWHDLPTALLSGMASVCPGQNASVQIAFTGVGPWSFKYALNGQVTPGISTPATYNILVTPQITQLFNMISVNDQFCSGVVNGTAEVQVLASPTGNLSGPTAVCPNVAAKIQLNLNGGTNYNITISGTNGWDTTIMNAQNGQQFFVQPTTPTTIYTITALTAIGNNCPAIFGGILKINVQEIFQSLQISNYGGFNISCPGATDGTLEVFATGGQPPYSFAWSNGSTAKKLTNLAEGYYQVTIIDAGGCRDSIYEVLKSPTSILLDWRSEPAACFGGQEGKLEVKNIFGGISPYKITINGSLSTVSNQFPITFSNLAAGSYNVEIEDANGCTSQNSVSVDAPAELLVNLGPDILLPLGDSARLEGLINYPIDSAWWSPVKYLASPDSLISQVNPLATIRYQLTVRDSNGCTATDFILVEVDATRHIFVPNAFSPTKDGLNDKLTVYGGSDVVEILNFQIYDRWGNRVFENKNFQPNDVTDGWDGKFRGKLAPPVVYAYVLKVAFKDGAVEIYHGDVTLVR
jgi:gliding motility-associated-like protein